MKTFLPIMLAACLSACVDSPSMKETMIDGTVLEYKMGRTFMGKQKQLVAEVTGPSGRKLKFMVGEIDTTEVPRELIRTAAAAATTIGLAKSAADQAISESKDRTAEVLGAQSVQKNKDTLEAAGKATSEALPLAEPGSIKISEIKPPGS
jgi:hypothetical protein